MSGQGPQGTRARAGDPAARDADEEVLVRQERMKRLAQYSEEKLRDKGASLGWWLKAHAEDHESEELREQIERLAARYAGLEPARRRVCGIAAEVRRQA
jgi:hypothetical protein